VGGIGPFPAGDHGTITVSDSTGASITLTDVLWGDVFLCSGQSNMVFSANQSYTAATDIAAANAPKYQSIRLFTSQPLFASGPLVEFQKVEQAWTRANSSAVGHPAAFTYFSAVCWHTGKNIFDSFKGTVPIGLVCSAFGGTRVHQWSGPNALKKCNQSIGGGAVPRTPTRSWPPTRDGVSDADAAVTRAASVGAAANSDSGLWWGMITPLLRMQFKAAFWLQGESDVNPTDDVMEPQRGGAYYACQIKAMVEDWRVELAQSLPFMWVQLSPWVGHEAATSFYQLPAIRQAQLSVTEVPDTGFASAVDLGDVDPSTNPWGGVHWRNKAPVGVRLAAVAQHLLYSSDEQFQGPAATTATTSVAASGSAATVTVRFDPATVGPAGLQMRPMVCPFFALAQPDNVARCGWMETRAAGGNWSNSTFAVAADGQSLAVDGVAGAAEVRYLFADWPVATVFNAAGFPATPFVLAVTSA